MRSQVHFHSQLLPFPEKEKIGAKNREGGRERETQRFVNGSGTNFLSVTLDLRVSIIDPTLSCNDKTKADSQICPDKHGKIVTTLFYFAALFHFRVAGCDKNTQMSNLASSSPIKCPTLPEKYVSFYPRPLPKSNLENADS